MQGEDPKGKPVFLGSVLETQGTQGAGTRERSGPRTRGHSFAGNPGPLKTHSESDIGVPKSVHRVPHPAGSDDALILGGSILSETPWATSGEKHGGTFNARKTGMLRDRSLHLQVPLSTTLTHVRGVP